MRFPGGFVWGASTSAAQIEGGVDLDGRGPSIWDTFAAQPGAVADGTDPSVAADHRRRWRDDVDLLVPLSVPALAAFAIFQFLWVWNDLLVAYVFLGGTSENRVLTIALQGLNGAHGEDWHLLTSAAFITMALPLLVFFSLQRYFVRGLTAGSVKG